jgi:uncharacterized protein (DUF924 family)
MFHKVLEFWFEELDPSQWWVQDDQLDNSITMRFSEIHRKARQCEFFEWRVDARGRLAEIIVLDQFSRNMFRGSAMSFACDSTALALSQEAISVGADEELNAIECSFLYMPFMHSESLKIHEIALGLYEKNGIRNNYDFEVEHKLIIEQFGRYPHRNKLLDRVSTDDEIEFLKQPGSSF